MSSNQAAHSRLWHEQALQYEEAESIYTIATVMQQAITTLCTQLGLVAVTMQFTKEGIFQAEHALQVEQAIPYYLEQARAVIRKTDRVFWHKQSLYFLLLQADIQGAQTVQTRIWEALLWRIHHMSEVKLPRPVVMTIGHSAFPQPYDQALRCLTEASEPRHSFEAVPDRAARKTSRGQSRTDENKEGELPIAARKLGIPYLSLLPQKQSWQVQHILNPKLAQELRCYPLGYEHGTLTVAVANLQDTSTLDRLHEATGMQIFPVLAPQHEVQSALERLSLLSH